MTEQSFYRQHRIAILIALVLALGPLTALTLGSMYADEETLARAEAGDRNMEPVDRYGDYELPTAEGEAASLSVVDVIDGAKPFDRFHGLVQRSDMAGVLDGPGPFTLFVPVNDAFQGLTQQQRDALTGDQTRIVELVSAHVARGRMAATDLMQKERIETLGGESFGVGESGHLGIGDAEIIKADLIAGNGVVHVVDGFVR
jgi:uncharacterized surface protein with fasciclin (FAS1) repeats